MANLSLQMPLQEVLNTETEHVIELHAVLIEHSDADKTTQKRISLEKMAEVLEKTPVRKRKYFMQTNLVETLLLVRTTRRAIYELLEGLADETDVPALFST